MALNLIRGSLRAYWKKRFDKWLAERVPPRDKVTLNRRIIYILPTRNGLMFIVFSGVIFIAAINYAVSLAFGLAFLMISIFILAILYSFNNLNRLTLSNQPSPPVFCGEEASFKVQLSRSSSKKYEALELNFPDANITHVDLVFQDQDRVNVFLKTSRRGEFKAPILRVTTYFPLGLCRAWSVVDLNLHCLVYPRPVAFVMDQFSSGSSGTDDSAISTEGSEDFYGLREYVPGDSMRQVAWKNVARGQGMQVKQFVDYVDNKVWLDWDMFYGFGVEERLSRLCYCVLKLSKSGNPFGLKMPGIEIAPSSGIQHKIRLLKALALYGATA
jgi:uncharacterized protein (DUF58 family)